MTHMEQARVRKARRCQQGWPAAAWDRVVVSPCSHRAGTRARRAAAQPACVLLMYCTAMTYCSYAALRELTPMGHADASGQMASVTRPGTGMHAHESAKGMMHAMGPIAAAATPAEVPQVPGLICAVHQPVRHAHRG